MSKQQAEKSLEQRQARGEEKARFADTIRDWFLGRAVLQTVAHCPNIICEVVGESVNFYEVRQGNTLAVLGHQTIIDMLISASITESAHCGPHFKFSKKDADNCFAHIRSLITKPGREAKRWKKIVKSRQILPIAFENEQAHYDARWAQEEDYNRWEPDSDLMVYRLISDAEHMERMPESEQVYAFQRFPLLKFAAPSDPSAPMEMGPFMESLRERMEDYDETTGVSIMFNRLLSAIGALLWDSEPRREVVYWQGEGGDGKTTLCSFLGTMLGDAALLNVDPKELSREYYRGALLGKRFVQAEEAPRGAFLTEAVKAITGSPFISARLPRGEVFTFPNRSFIWFCSNHDPIIDGTNAALDRFVFIKSRSALTKRPTQEIFEELRQWWPHIVFEAFGQFHAAGGRVHPMSREETEDPIAGFYLHTDGWISQNLVHQPGAFLPTSTLKMMLPHFISIADAKRRLTILQGTAWVAGTEITPGKARVGKAGGSVREMAPIHGYRHVGIADPGTWGRLHGRWIPGKDAETVDYAPF